MEKRIGLGELGFIFILGYLMSGEYRITFSFGKQPG